MYNLSICQFKGKFSIICACTPPGPPNLLPSCCFAVMVLIVIIYTRQRKPTQYVLAVQPDDDVRENIIHYNEEGMGEEDQNVYDMKRLKKPLELDAPPPTAARKPVPATHSKPLRKRQSHSLYSPMKLCVCM